MSSEESTRWSLWIFASVMAFSVFACIYLALSQLSGMGLRVPFKSALAMITALVLLAAAIKTRPAVVARLNQVARIHGLWMAAVAVGVALRLIVWRLSWPEVQINDGESYLQLAKLLYEGKEYRLNGYAFWPPGTPFIYAAFMRLLGNPPYLALIVNLLFFVLAATSVRSIVNRLGFTAEIAGLSVALLAVWPGLLLGVAQVGKEYILLGLLPCVFALLLWQRRWAALAAGLVAGLAVLTQPSLMFLPLLFGLGLVGAGCPVKQTLLRLGAMLIGMIIVISPWTYRNYGVFGEFVAVSTNAGLVLHAGNQRAMVRPVEQVGGFITPPMPENAFENDLAASRWHSAAAFSFIKNNPSDFSRLVFNRLVLTMGDDSDSAYRSLRLTGKVSQNAYLLFKALCNAYWMALAAFLCSVCWTSRNSKERLQLAPVLIISTAASLYLMAIHGLAEGGARHHMAWAWAYSLLLAHAAALQGTQKARLDASRVSPADRSARQPLQQ